MKRALSVVGMVLLAMVVSVRPAGAWDFWDWLQEFSGPGPFHTGGRNLMLDICPQLTLDIKDGVKNTDLATAQKFLRDFDQPLDPLDTAKANTARYEATHANNREQQVVDDLKAAETAAATIVKNRQDQGDAPSRATCFFADVRLFENNSELDTFGAGKVNVNVYEFGVSTRLHRAITLGFGGGAMVIKTDDHTALKGVLTGPRVTIKPLLLFGSNTFWIRHNKLHILASSVKYYVKEDMVLGTVRGQDFGLPPTHPNYNFQAPYDRVASTGFIFDPSDLVVLGLRALTK